MKSIRPSDLPSPPQTALDIMQACSSDDVDFNLLTDIVKNDPHLTAEILRLVNSAFYARGSTITTVAQAISVIGLKSLQNLSLCFAVKNSFNDCGLDAEFLKDFWRDSICRAVSARYLAAVSNLDADECFTIGLLQDLGLLIIFYLEPDNVSYWPELRVMSPDQRLLKERQYFNTSHVDVMQELGSYWVLPQAIMAPILHHHECATDESSSQICQFIESADWFNYVLVSDFTEQSAKECKSYLSNHIELSESQIDEALEQISLSIADAAHALGISVDSYESYSALLQKTNVQLAKDNLDYQQLNWRLKTAIEERDRLAKELDKEIQLAKEIQESLLPERNNLPISGLNVAAKKLSGDFYDYYQLKDNKILFILADVSGKGINASLLMVKVSSLFHCLGKYISDLKQLAQVLNRELCETSVRGMFVTMICGKLDLDTGDLELLNAGHPPAVIIHGQEVSLVKAEQIPLGIDNKVNFTSTKHNIKNSKLYLFSDGLLELKRDNVEIGLDSLIEDIKATNHLPCHEQLGLLKSQLESETLITNDDLTVLIIDGKAASV